MVLGTKKNKMVKVSRDPFCEGETGFDIGWSIFDIFDE